MDVTVFLEPTVDIDRLAEILDGMGHQGRVHTMRTWDKKRMARLFDACAGRSITLDHLVPPSIGPGVEVIHDLRNTLPLFSDAQKRFAKVESEDFAMGGFNRQFGVARVSEPGYFVVSEGEGEHANELVIDYTKVPKSKPSSWPEIEANDQGFLNKIVWGGMVDYLRRVSTHVSIGRATKDGKAIGQYFALVRRDPS
ncbi:MAG: hypothetical protein JST00_02245 [Deltaproteobacteria bacterium]|nr:hypothetical protein [Deltaproteobacteria bacterium]